VAVAELVRVADGVVPMGLRMPAQDGVSAIQEIISSHPDVRIVVPTTYGTDSDVLRAIEAGAVGYLFEDPHTKSCFGRFVRSRAGNGISPPRSQIASWLAGSRAAQ
jgi:DNA-binding NarL/FixJ family response regulator